tara:strand:- start:373 stop:477 length:105 start_codon:yes stop_codon:yes gene_type:complete
MVEVVEVLVLLEMILLLVTILNHKMMVVMVDHLV